jgi:hypothetical protein
MFLCETYVPHAFPQQQQQQPSSAVSSRWLSSASAALRAACDRGVQALQSSFGRILASREDFQGRASSSSSCAVAAVAALLLELDSTALLRVAVALPCAGQSPGAALLQALQQAQPGAASAAITLSCGALILAVLVRGERPLSCRLLRLQLAPLLSVGSAAAAARAAAAEGEAGSSCSAGGSTLYLPLHARLQQQKQQQQQQAASACEGMQGEALAFPGTVFALVLAPETAAQLAGGQLCIQHACLLVRGPQSVAL